MGSSRIRGAAAALVRRRKNQGAAATRRYNRYRFSSGTSRRFSILASFPSLAAGCASRGCASPSWLLCGTWVGPFGQGRPPHHNAPAGRLPPQCAHRPACVVCDRGWALYRLMTGLRSGSGGGVGEASWPRYT